MTDDLAFLDRHDDGRLPNGAKGRPKCRRHEWVIGWQKCEPSYRWSESQQWPDDIPTVGCRRCYKVKDTAASRRGRSSLRAGKDAERAIAKAYGGTRTGQFGGPDDVVVGELFVVQSKCGRTWFQQRVVDELDKLPRAGGRIPTLVVSNRPGPGHQTRRYVVRLLEDDVALHGERP